MNTYNSLGASIYNINKSSAITNVPFDQAQLLHSWLLWTNQKSLALL